MGVCMCVWCCSVLHIHKFIHIPSRDRFDLKALVNLSFLARKRRRNNRVDYAIWVLWLSICRFGHDCFTLLFFSFDGIELSNSIYCSFLVNVRVHLARICCWVAVWSNVFQHFALVICNGLVCGCGYVHRLINYHM